MEVVDSDLMISPRPPSSDQGLVALIYSVDKDTSLKRFEAST